MTHVPIADAVRVLREQLESAVDAKENSLLHFELGTIELEFHVVYTTEGTGQLSAGFKLLSFDAGAKTSGKIENEQVQKIKLVLTPKLVKDGQTNSSILSRQKKSDQSAKSDILHTSALSYGSNDYRSHCTNSIRSGINSERLSCHR